MKTRQVGLKEKFTASSLALISNERTATMVMTPYRRVHVKSYVKFIMQSPGGSLKCRKIHEIEGKGNVMP